LTNSFDPKFNERESELVRVAAATCQIVTLDITGHHYVTGTAFFIGPHTLLTAGHTISSKKGPVYTQGPGVESTKSPRAIYNADGVNRITLYVRDHLGDGTGGPDLAILDTKSSYTHGSPLEILWDAQLVAGKTVDVIGYPGTYTDDYIQKNYKQQVADVQAAYNDAQSLLPQRRLSVSCGQLISGGNKPEYRVTTFGGMSGSPVVYQGKVVGNFLCFLDILTVFRYSHWRE
jgi:V8-like Glu-specific endopeptidase